MNAGAVPPSAVDVAAWIRAQLSGPLYQLPCPAPADVSLESYAHFIGHVLYPRFRASHQAAGYAGCQHEVNTDCALARFVLEVLSDPSAAEIVRTLRYRAHERR